MSKIERKIIQWIQQHLTELFALAITLCSLVIRISFRKFESIDSGIYLLPWWEEIRNNGGIYALESQVGDYNMLYQFLIAVMTYLPVKPLYQYKLLSGIFDYLLAATVGYVTYDLTDKSRERGLMAYVTIVMSPVVILNSSAWAQCDAIYVFFIILSLLMLMKERCTLAFVILGIAFSFKLQTIFIIPFFIYYYFKKKNFTILNFAIIPLVMCLVSIPNLIMGRSIQDVFLNYARQTNTHADLTLNYPSFWCIFNQAVSLETLEEPAVMLTIALLGIFIYLWLTSENNMESKKMIYSAFLIAYTCVFFLPRMHERYGYMYEILSVPIAFTNKKTIPLCVMLNVISMITYAQFLYGTEYDARILACVNGLVYLLYIMILMPQLLKNEIHQ